MADAYFGPQPQPQFTTPRMNPSSFPSKRRKVVGQCPACEQSFSSRTELRAHMSDPVTHAPASDSDAVSFGELSDYDSLDETSSQKQSPTHEHEPTLASDGFEFSSKEPHLEQDGFEFADVDASFHPSTHMEAEQGSIHTLPDTDVQSSTEYTPIETPPHKARMVRGGALGVLYCGTCDKYFGNERVFKRHFMFGARHGEELRDMRELYYRAWGSSWMDEVERREANVQEVDHMEI